VAEATKNTPPKMTNERRITRRRLIAQAVKDGNTPDRVCAHFGVAISLVVRSCKEHDVQIPRRQPSPRYMGRTIEILARLCKPQPAETFATIASDLRIQRARVDQVFQEAKRLGFSLPRWGEATNGRTRAAKDAAPCQPK
jgi:hypothetical protein